MLKAHKFRLYPNAEQANFMWRNIGGARKMFNLLVADEQVQYRMDRISPLTDGLHPRKTYSQHKLSDGNEWMSELDNLVLANAQQDYRAARKNAFDSLSGKRKGKKVGFPKFKSLHRSAWTATTNNQNAKSIFTGSIHVSEDQKYIKLPKMKQMIRIRGGQAIPENGKLKRATYRKSRSGKWYISILVEQQALSSLPKTNKMAAGDAGLASFLTMVSKDLRNPSSDFDINVIERNRLIKRSERKLAREQKKLSRRAQQAKRNGIKLSEAHNYQKQKVKVARIHEHVKNQRLDMLCKIARYLVEQFDVIKLEKLNIRGLMKNRKLSKAYADVGWSDFVRILHYMADWYGKTVQFVNPKYTTQDDYETGERIKKPLSVRKYINSLGHEIDRDVNAAMNIFDAPVIQ